jgi:hypothetical protein
LHHIAKEVWYIDNFDLGITSIHMLCLCIVELIFIFHFHFELQVREGMKKSLFRFWFALVEIYNFSETRFASKVAMFEQCLAY